MTASKLPDLNEIASMAGKLFSDLKRSVTEIAKDYQEKHKCTEDEKKPSPKAERKPTHSAAKSTQTETPKPAGKKAKHTPENSEDKSD